jgi:hypothetical protein
MRTGHIARQRTHAVSAAIRNQLAHGQSVGIPNPRTISGAPAANSRTPWWAPASDPFPVIFFDGLPIEAGQFFAIQGCSCKGCLKGKSTNTLHFPFVGARLSVIGVNTN